MGKTREYGFIDKTGKVVIPAVFDEAFPFSEGFAYVTVGLESYFIDKKGKKAIVPEKEPRSNGYFSRFRHGLAADDVGYIDTTGKYVWKCPPGVMCRLESEE
ncbi:MAG: WG repeat-containing protein [Acidobacteria bacterium]|nr:WG repeat-containing protein [Acidobacteriota bacterium]